MSPFFGWSGCQNFLKGREVSLPAPIGALCTLLYILYRFSCILINQRCGSHLILTWIRIQILGSTFGNSGSGSSDPPFRNSGSGSGSSVPHLEKVDPDPSTYFSYFSLKNSCRTNQNAYFYYRQNLEKAFLR